MRVLPTNKYKLYQEPDFSTMTAKELADYYINSERYKTKLGKQGYNVDETVEARNKRLQNTNIIVDENAKGASALYPNITVTPNTSASVEQHEIGHNVGGSFITGTPGDAYTINPTDVKTISKGNTRADLFYKSGETSYNIAGEEDFKRPTKYVTGPIDPETGLMILDNGLGYTTPLEVNKDGTVGKGVDVMYDPSRHAVYEPEIYGDLFSTQLSFLRLGIVNSGKEKITTDHVKTMIDSKDDASIGVSMLVEKYGLEGAVDKLNTVADASNQIDDGLEPPVERV